MYTSSGTLFLLIAISWMGLMVHCKRTIYVYEQRMELDYMVVDDIDYFPYLMQLRNEDGKFICAGALIDPLYVLTAAECFDRNNYTKISVIAGASKLSDNGTVRQIAHIKKYPDRYINVAVLKLNEPMIGFKPIEFMEEEEYNVDLTFVVALGWRHLARRQSDIKVLARYSTKTISQTECEMKFYAATTKKLFCIHEPCVSDLGGPITTDGLKLVGIVSKGQKCVEPRHFTAATNVLEILKFIKDAMK